MLILLMLLGGGGSIGKKKGISEWEYGSVCSTVHYILDLELRIVIPISFENLDPNVCDEYITIS